MKVWVKKTLGLVLVAAPLALVSTSLTGCLTDDKKDDTTHTGTTSELSMKTVLLGAQGNSNPSALDLDTWTAYTASAGAAHAADVDLIFAYSTSAGFAALYSPNIAKNGVAGASGGFDFMSSWTTANTTLMREVTVADTAALKTAASIKALYDAGTDPAVVGRIEAKAGHYIVARSDGGLYVLIGITAVTSAADGTANITGWAKW